MRAKSKRISLTSEDREKLQKIVRQQKTERRLFFRASIVLQLGGGRSAKEVTADLNTTIKSVRKWRNRFLARGIDGLIDMPRSGVPGKFSAGQRCEVIAIACDSPINCGFKEYSRWNYDILTTAVQANDIPMSRSSVVRTLEENELHPHKYKPWLHSKDPDFKEKVNKVVDLYTRPAEENVAIICVDEKTGIQATERKYETERPIPGRPGRYEYEYIRHGTQTLIAGFNIHNGQISASCGPTRTADDLITFMEEVAEEYKATEKIIIIWDNLNIHYDGEGKRWTEFNERHQGKFEFVYTPLHASWVNQVEIFFSILQRRCLKWASFRSQEELKSAIMAFIRRWNEKEGHPFNWTFRGYPMQSKIREAA